MTPKPFVILIGIILLFRAPAVGQAIGLQLRSFHKELSADPTNTFEKVKNLGFTEVEMTDTYGLPFPKFIKLLAVNGLNVISFETSLDKLESSPETVTDEARSYGAKYIVCKAFVDSGQLSKIQIEKIALALNQAGKVVAQNGLLLCYHPGSLEFNSVGDETLFDYLIQKIDTRVVYMTMDPFAVKKAGKDPVALLKRYPTRFVLMYLRDSKLSPKNSENNVVLGSGDIGISDVMRTARNLGIQYYFIQDESANADKQIPASLAFLKTIETNNHK